MKLYLIQHAQAKPKQEDSNRGLTDEGKKTIQKTARFFGSINPEIAEIRYSTKLRSKQTAELLAGALNKTGLLKVYEGMTPKDPVEPLVHELHTAAHSLVIVGHLPFLSKLASELLCQDHTIQPVAFYNAGIVCLLKNNDHWQVDWSVPPWLL
ncbi:MAG: phosphohistidine phosphatase SixA [Spirochaetales bacterium]|nr:phosphohistidine phosphatase SixA [Spirochaetales bacterium]